MSVPDVNRIRSSFFFVFCALFLTGCGTHHPTAMFLEPEAGSSLATVRLITNGVVHGGEYDGCVADLALMLRAGRVKEGRYNPAHMPAPYPPATLGLPGRKAPRLLDIWPGHRLAQGYFAEAIAEYSVPAARPFMIKGSDIHAYAPGFSSGYVCRGEARIYRFEAGRSYEIVVGMAAQPTQDGPAKPVCLFSAYELGENGPDVIESPHPLSFSTPEGIRCNSTRR